MQTGHTTRVAQREADHQRRADDGDFIPDLDVPAPVDATRQPWLAVGIAAALGFALGWLTASPDRGGR